MERERHGKKPPKVRAYWQKARELVVQRFLRTGFAGLTLRRMRRKVHASRERRSGAMCDDAARRTPTRAQLGSFPVNRNRTVCCCGLNSGMSTTGLRNDDRERKLQEWVRPFLMVRRNDSRPILLRDRSGAGRILGCWYGSDTFQEIAMDRDVLVHQMTERFQELYKRALDALDGAPDGQ